MIVTPINPRDEPTHNALDVTSKAERLTLTDEFLYVTRTDTGTRAAAVSTDAHTNQRRKARGRKRHMNNDTHTSVANDGNRGVKRRQTHRLEALSLHCK